MEDNGIAPRFKQSALITVDTQIDTLTQPFREFGRPIIHGVRLYLADGSNAEPGSAQTSVDALTWHALRRARPARLTNDSVVILTTSAGDGLR